MVVGAGPAGSTAARIAAEAGASVLLLDRARFPRYKTCGGGLIGISLDHVPASVLEVVEERVTEVRFTLRGRSRSTHRRHRPFLALVQRERFDQALVDAAIAAGVRFDDGVTVRSVGEDAGGVTLETSAGNILAAVVVGADGAGGRVGRYVGVTPAGVDLALESEIVRPNDGRSWDDRVYLDWGSEPGTYAWMFPKTETLTVGVIQRRGRPDATREYLELYTRQLGLEGAEIARSSGHLAQWRSPDSPVHRGRVIVAGDAAALLDPFTREGISFALRSGTWAGEAAASGDLAGYTARVERELAPEIAAGARLLHFFERHPGAVHRALAFTVVGTSYFIRVCRGETTLARLFAGRTARAALAILRR
ncbi:MAG: geranylgeranyl reductase family protein [Microbacteriaceae bacterium]|nr:geranylgeranyl reductase family protein [Microbacteriaceae bacterium]